MRRLGILLLVPFLLAGCKRPADTIRLGTTTSVDNSGLLAVLLPAFTERSGVDVQVLAVGTGKALALADKGDVDVTITHDPEAERRFVGTGKAKVYRKFMYNDFLIAGPKDDPAAIRGVASASDAMKMIAESSALFASRGDESGTHAREKKLWTAAGATPAKENLLETGQGMAATLRVASERGAYVLTDRATFSQLRDKLALDALVEGDPALLNTYAVIVVDQKNSLRELPALQFADWLRLGPAKSIIASFPDAKTPVFHPWPGDARGNDPDDRPVR